MVQHICPLPSPHKPADAPASAPCTLSLLPSDPQQMLFRRAGSSCTFQHQHRLPKHLLPHPLSSVAPGPHGSWQGSPAFVGDRGLMY